VDYPGVELEAAGVEVSLSWSLLSGVVVHLDVVLKGFMLLGEAVRFIRMRKQIHDCKTAVNGSISSDIRSDLSD
jgi:hypothetical protein